MIVKYNYMEPAMAPHDNSKRCDGGPSGFINGVATISAMPCGAIMCHTFKFCK